jgi:hypothetical protein
VVAPFPIVVKIGFQEIWKKEDFKNDKHDKKLD